MLKKLEREIELKEANYRVKEWDSCYSCKFLRGYGKSTCSKHHIAVNQYFGICNDCDPGYSIERYSPVELNFIKNNRKEKK